MKLEKIIREYHGQLYADKLDNLDEMDKFLETHKLTQEEIENLNGSVTIKRVESVIKNIPTKKSPGPEGFIGEFYQTSKELIPIFLKIFQKIEKERTVLNS